MEYIKKFKENLIKNENSIKEDVNLLNDILGSDKNFPSVLCDYYLSNESYSECFARFDNIKKCFISSDIFRFEKKLHGIEKDLYGLWTFQPGIYKHLKHAFFGDIRVEVARKVNSVTNQCVINDLKELNITDYNIVDIEFFEFSDWETQFDLSEKIKESKFKISNHRELSDYIKDNKLHLEKEKIHCKFIVGKNMGNKIILPLYFGIGTNEAYGLQLKVGDDKNRWFKLALDIDYPYIEKAYIKTVETDRKKVKNILDRYAFFGLTNEDTWSNGSVVCTIINKSSLDYKREKNNALICFLKCNVVNGSPSKPIAIVSPEYKKEQVNRIEIWRNYISGEKSVNAYLFELLEKSQKEYQSFFHMYNCPYRIISGLGTEKVARAIGLKYKKILSFNDYEKLSKCVDWNNINAIAGDIYKLGIDSERNRISSLIFTFLLKENRFDEIIDNEYGEWPI